MLLHLSRVCGATPALRTLSVSPSLPLRGCANNPAVISANFLIRQPFALQFLSDTFRLLPHLPRTSMRLHWPYLCAHGFLCSNRKSDQSPNSR